MFLDLSIFVLVWLITLCGKNYDFEDSEVFVLKNNLLDQIFVFKNQSFQSLNCIEYKYIYIYIYTKKKDIHIYIYIYIKEKNGPMEALQISMAIKILTFELSEFYCILIPMSTDII